jgi:hypothetical protein
MEAERTSETSVYFNETAHGSIAQKAVIFMLAAAART